MKTIKVGNYTIGDADVQSTIARLPEQQKMYGSDPSFINTVEQNLIDMAALATYAEEIGLAESEKFIDALATARRDILCQLGMFEVMNAAVITDEEVKKYYDDNPDKFVAPEHATAKHILVDTEEKANEIKASIESGDISFEDAAKANSSCPSSESGGDLGAFTRGQMVPEFDEVCFTEEIGKLVGPVKTQFGYHLVVVTDRVDSGKLALEDIKEQLEEQLLKSKQEAAYQAKVVELRERFGVK